MDTESRRMQTLSLLKPAGKYLALKGFPVHIDSLQTHRPSDEKFSEWVHVWAALLTNQFFMTFSPALPGSTLERVEIRNTKLVPWCRMERWRGVEGQRGREYCMSHIYVMLVTPAIRRTGSLCSYCLLSADEYVLSELRELSKICLWSPLEDLVPSQPLCCLLNFPHLWTLYTEHTWALFAISILKGYS